ncbi:hypothetical protein AM571_CH04095 [Rhizobium etli 8C-3]|uniref:Uncharacterized protein n=1 Tax=Rhizobium etli 8C-3 TaxID=538025 RepID=A0A1L5P9M7_RHIET|nr:hypothetical protein AM571_CH04095 [Rhizobium etli 8C-3]
MEIWASRQNTGLTLPKIGKFSEILRNPDQKRTKTARAEPLLGVFSIILLLTCGKSHTSGECLQWLPKTIRDAKS